MSETGQSLITILMLIGGSPGSTAGGMKTTTLAVLLASAFAVFRRPGRSAISFTVALPAKPYLRLQRS